MKHIIDIIKENQNKEFNNKNYVDIFVSVRDEILCLRRANYLKFNRGKWCLPGGHIDKGENSSEAIKRELKEETNINIGKAEFLFTHEYENGSQTSIYKVDLNEKPEIKISREHAQFKWLTFEEIQKMKEKFPQETFEIIEKISKIIM